MDEVGSVFCGEAAIRVGNIVHSLLMWLRSIVVQKLYRGKQHFLGKMQSRPKKGRKLT